MPQIRAFRSLYMICLLGIAGGLALAVPPADIARAIDQLVAAQPSLAKADIGIAVRSLDNGDLWYSRNANRPFVPASVAKLVTGMLAVEYLGPGYRCITRVTTDGRVEDGVLRGNLYLRGSGDPALTTEELRGLARTLAVGDPARGVPPIRHVRGMLVVDDGFFPRPGPLLGTGWQADDLPWYYAAPGSAVSCNRNAVTVIVTGTTAGKRPSVVVTPETNLFIVRNLARTSGASCQAAIQPRGYTLTVSGTIGPGRQLVEKVSIPDPTRFTTEQFLRALNAEGITVSGTRMGTTPPHCSVLAEHASPTVGELLLPLLKDSDNHVAEQLRWTLLALYSLEKPLAERYAALLNDFGAHSGMRAYGIHLVDGSGLSRLNRITPTGMVHLLTSMATSEHRVVFRQALPVAGVDGTLKTRLSRAPARNNAFLKTGTMSGACTLAGYITTVSGEQLVCAIFINNYPGKATAARALGDNVVEYLAGQ